MTDNRMANTNGRTYILIASDRPIFRDGLIQVLQSERGSKFATRGCSCGEALRVARKLEPDIVLLDFGMFPYAKDEALKALTSLPAVHTILLGTPNGKEQILELLQLGVRGIVPKESPVEVLIRSMQSVLAGQYWVERNSVDGILHALRNAMPSPHSQPKADRFGITSRELQIVAAVALGQSNKVIAKTLSISVQTVKHHLTNIFGKLGVSGRLELALFATNHKLVSQD